MNTKTAEPDEPAAWIGCLSCYNEGELFGKWITARTAADDDTSTFNGLAKIVNVDGYIAPRCVKCGGDEFDIFDTDNMPTRIDLISFYKNAEQLADLYDAGDLDRIIVLADYVGTTDLNDLIEYDKANYITQAATWADFAAEWADETITHRLPDNLIIYFDYEKHARDLAHDFTYDENTGHVWGQR